MAACLFRPDRIADRQHGPGGVENLRTLIFLNPDPDEREIQLLEVSSAAPTSGELYPFSYTARPDLGINYPSVVLLLSGEEWDAVRKGSLPLPSGWTLDRLQEL